VPLSYILGDKICKMRIYILDVADLRSLVTMVKCNFILNGICGMATKFHQNSLWEINNCASALKFFFGQQFIWATKIMRQIKFQGLLASRFDFKNAFKMLISWMILPCLVSISLLPWLILVTSYNAL